MKFTVCDIETDSLNPTKIWVIVLRDVETGYVQTFTRPDENPSDFLSAASSVDYWVGHNFLQFDYLKVLRKFFPSLVIPVEKIVDTLICARLIRFDFDGGHSLEAWGERLGIQKPKISDWSQGATPEMVHRCVEDTEINVKLFLKMKNAIFSDAYRKAVLLEHQVQMVCEDMSHNGFGFDIDKAKEMMYDIQTRLRELDKEIEDSFPPTVYTEMFIPKVTRKDLGYVKGVPFTRTSYIPFNPASPVQIVKALNEAGWAPTEKTKGHINAERELRMCRLKKDDPKRKLLEEKLEKFRETGYSVNEENLSTLPSNAPPGARKLAERITLASRLSTLVEWIGLYNTDTGSIHGTFLHIGSWTGRMAHQKPNMANIPSAPEVQDRNNPTPVEQIKLKYNIPMRGLFITRPKRRLVGVDADGIQLRILAHYMEDKDFIEALVNGKKEDQTDAHSLNCLKLDIGYEFRPRAKTFIYAFVLGAGTDKVSQILHCSLGDARSKTDLFIEGYPGLKKLKSEFIPEAALNGFFIGLDGRPVPVPSEHKVLAGMLQNGESIVMKTANILWRTELKSLGIPFYQVNFVHDEWQTEVPDDDEVARIVEKAMCDSIAKAGVLLNVRCPLLGTGGSQGYSWAETH